MSRSSRIDSRHDTDRPADGGSATARCFSELSDYPGGVSFEISPRDHMYNSYDPPDREGYLSHGRAALDCIRVSMLAAQKESAQSILDLPSGHGRVLRFLRAEYPQARIAACDIDHEAVDFCAEAFGATPVYGRERPGEIELGDQFDLIWCGSLFTHLDHPLWNEFLDLFESALVTGGVLIFTTCGRNLASKLADAEEGKNLMKQEDRRKTILEGYRETGFGYADYDLPEEMRKDLSLPRRFGISLSSPSWVCGLLETRPRLQLLTFTENRWGAQDVVTCMCIEDIDLAQPFRTPLGVQRGS